jgi:MFS transporter (putative signal transducer)
MQAVSQPSSAALLTGIAGLYVAQSVIGGITWTGLPAVMRKAGVSLDMIGFVSLIALPWVFKFLWAPAVERYRLPPEGRNRSGTIVIVGGLVSIAGLVLVGALDPANALPILGVLTIIAFAASTVDIACDGFAVQSLAKHHHGWGNAAQVGGAYLGSALGGGLFLYLVGTAGWHVAIWAMAAVLLLLGFPFLFAVVPRMPAETREHVPSLAAALHRPLLRKGLVAAATFVIAQKMAAGMIGPFLVDAGVDLATIGVLNGIGSLLVGTAAALLGGGCVRLWGTRTVLILALLLQAVLLSLFAFAGWSNALPVPALMALAVASSSGIMAFGFVALYAQFMRWSDPQQAGVDFTLFQCMDALVSMAGGIAAGYIANAFGYGVFFAGAAGVAVAVIPVIAMVSER